MTATKFYAGKTGTSTVGPGMLYSEHSLADRKSPFKRAMRVRHFLLVPKHMGEPFKSQRCIVIAIATSLLSDCQCAFIKCPRRWKVAHLMKNARKIV
jgi:hypothetical protein